MVKCPRCGSEVSNILKEWDYSVFHVKKLYCQKCDDTFSAYYYKEKLSHTIPTPKKS